MLRVKRNNVILRINDVDKQHYIDKGFSVIDNHGQVVESAQKDIGALERKNEQLLKENAELKDLVKKLKSDLRQAAKEHKTE